MRSAIHMADQLLQELCEESRIQNGSLSYTVLTPNFCESKLFTLLLLRNFFAWNRQIAILPMLFR